jgi:hypothetical protein
VVALDKPIDYLWMFLVAAGLGAVGGIAYELLQMRRGDSGALEIPRRRGRYFLDLGFVSSMILGAVAAVAISYFFTPEIQVIERGQTATKWQIARLVPLSLIVGSAGGAFLSAMQARLKLDTTRRIATQQFDEIGKAAKSQVTNAAGVHPQSDERKAVEEAAADSIDGVVETAKAAITAV